jgi:hypothetical protein
MSIGVLDKDGNPQTIATIDDLIAIVGAVTASPVSNSIQDRLKALATALAQLHTDETQLHTDLTTTLIAGFTPLATQATLASALTALNSLVSTFATFASPGPQPVANSTAVCDSGSGIASVWGVSGVPFTSVDQHSAAASVTDAPTSGQKLVIDDIIFSSDTAMWVTFKEETSGTVVFGPWYCSAASGPIQITPRSKKKLATADKKLQAITSVAGNISVHVGYHSEA